MVTLKFKTFTEFFEYAHRVKQERERAEQQTVIEAYCASCGELFVPSNYPVYWKTASTLAMRCPHCGDELELEHLKWSGEIGPDVLTVYNDMQKAAEGA